MREKRSNIVYIKHIRDAIEKIDKYSSKHTFAEFVQEHWDQDAVVRNLEIIGEAANNLDLDFRNNYSQIPWRAIIDFRNVATHDYADLDLAVVWQIITVDLPKLKKQIEQILHQHTE